MNLCNPSTGEAETDPRSLLANQRSRWEPTLSQQLIWRVTEEAAWYHPLSSTHVCMLTHNMCVYHTQKTKNYINNIFHMAFVFFNLLNLHGILFCFYPSGLAFGFVKFPTILLISLTFLCFFCFFFFGLFVCLFLRQGCLCSLGWPGTRFVDQVGSNSCRSTCLCLPNAGTKGLCHHTWLLGLSYLTCF